MAWLWLASLSEGEVMDGQIFCPFDGGSFDLATGAAIESPCTIPIRTYRVRVRDEHILIWAQAGAGTG